MKKLLIDTSIIIDFLRQKEKISTPLYKLLANDLYTSIITHTEVYSGKSVWEKKEAMEDMAKLFSGITILPLIVEISQKAGRIKAYDHDRSILDCIIAATVLYHGLDLVTLNVKDFRKIKGIKIADISKMTLEN